MNISQLMTLHILALKSSGKITHGRINEIVISTPYEEFRNYFDVLAHQKNLEDIFLAEKDWNIALRTLEKHETLGISCLPFLAKEYPRYLRSIKNYPLILYCRGNIGLLRDLPGAAVVGTRKITPNGLIVTERITKYLVSKGWIIVSGLALGVDAKAHESCLDAGGKTIAVLAHGLEEAQPKSNAALGLRILEQGGLWVSEHPIGTAIRKEYFVQRNRIQLGLSAGSIIIEAEIRSGTMTQAKFCKEQERPLFAVVPMTESNPLGLLSDGTMHMVEELGAMPLRNKGDYPSMQTRLSNQRAIMANL